MIDWLWSNRIPVLISLFWLVGLGAYGAGFLSLYNPSGEAVQTPPLLNLLFFCFALFGPLCMIWGVVLIANRSAGLAERVRVQSEVAAKLGQKLGAVEALLNRQHRQVEDRFMGTIRGLEKKLEETATEMVGIVAQLTDDASDILNKRGASLDQSLAKIENTVNARLEDRLGRVDEALTTGTASIEQRLASQMNALSEILDARISSVDKTLADGQTRMSDLIEQQETGTSKAFDQAADLLDQTLIEASDKLNTELVARASALDEAIDSGTRRMEDALNAKTAFLTEALSGADSGFTSRVAENEEKLKAFVSRQSAHIERAVTSLQQEVGGQVAALTTEIGGKLAENQAQIEAAFARRSENLDEQNRKLEVDLPRQIGQIEQTVASVARTLSTNPPASDADIAARVGDAALKLIGPERQALSDLVAKMHQLEEQVLALIAQMDRTARMNAAYDRPAPAGSKMAATNSPALPFAELPPSKSAKGMDWTLTLRALDLPDAKTEAGRPVMREAAKDKPLGDLVALANRVQEHLAEDGLFLRDLTASHANVETWQRYAEGAREDSMAQELSGIDDDIALTLARKRLRTKAAFRDLAFQFVAGYQRLIARAVQEGYQGSHLLELAETQAGRAFMLLGQLTRAFERPHDLFED
ncbi:MAG: hypothetical protein AAF503_13505 [Pseudomonadota bacterium]